MKHSESHAPGVVVAEVARLRAVINCYGPNSGESGYENYFTTLPAKRYPGRNDEGGQLAAETF